MSFRHILVPVDFGKPSERAIDLAVTIAMRFDAVVTLVHVAWMPPYYYSAYAEGLAFPLEEMETRAKKLLEEASTRVKERYRRVETMMISGEAWEKIVEAAKTCDADLIVMATHARTGVPRFFLGSVAEKVLRHSPVPVLTVGPERGAEGV